MRTLKTITTALATAALFAMTGCQLNPSNPGVPGSPDVKHPDVPGTVFTIVFENKDAQQVLKPSIPTFFALSEKYGSADAYISSTHPSLPNYIMMTSGDTQGIGNDNGPLDNIVIKGTDNLADQLEAAGVEWRGYMDGMGTPCKMVSDGEYVPHHAPFLYYSTLASDKARCEDRIVDFEKNFTADLAADTYRYMWITPDMCNNMHSCDPEVADAWLKKTVDQIMASPGYKAGGAIFILFDEGNLRILGAAADLPTIVISPNLIEPGYSTDTTFDHRSYLATVEDIFEMPRLATTKDAVPMDEFFVEKK